MILKKPYAFLIKNFKLIHLVLVVLMGYVAYKSYYVVDFLNQSVNNNYTSIFMGEIAGTYINYFVYLSVFLIIALLVAIYYLLSHKNKPRKIYMYTIIYYVVFFVLLTVFYSYINEIATEGVSSTSSLRAYRDISIISVLPQIVFIVYSFITVIGFNIKKFNFGEDLKELEIADEDNEEFEFSVNRDNYKLKRGVRKKIRELRYYVIENKFVFTIIVIVTGIIVVTSVFLKREVYSNDYKISDNITHNIFKVVIEDSIISPLSYNGGIIKDGKYYVAVKAQITNNSNKDEYLDYSNFRLETKSGILKPVPTDSLFFKDFATPYYGNKIRGGKSETISFVYEISKKDIAKNYVLKMYRGAETKPGEIISKYSDVDVNPVLVDTISDANEVSIGEELLFNYSNIGKTKFVINDFMFTKNYNYSYEKCDSNDNCISLDDSVAVDYSLKGDYNMLLVMGYEYKLDKDSIYAQTDTSIKEFVSNFMKVKYTINGQEKYSKVYYRNDKNLKDKLVVQTASDINKADNVSVVFTVRNKNYIIDLK